MRTSEQRRLAAVMGERCSAEKVVPEAALARTSVAPLLLERAMVRVLMEFRV
jgi:hypothetical protein